MGNAVFIVFKLPFFLAHVFNGNGILENRGANPTHPVSGTAKRLLQE
jgi:hypothetical protein